MADFKQATEWLKQGNGVRRRCWIKDMYTIWSENTFAFINGDEDSELTIMDNFEAIDWELYEDNFCLSDEIESNCSPNPNYREEPNVKVTKVQKAIKILKRKIRNEMVKSGQHQHFLQMGDVDGAINSTFGRDLVC